MKLRRIMAQIESEDTFAALAIASDRRNFRRFAEKMEVYRDLVTACSRWLARVRVALRASRLLYTDFDRLYAHPHDTAIALYLMALSQVGFTFPAGYCRDFMHPCLFWARFVAMEILAKEKVAA